MQSSWGLGTDLAPYSPQHALDLVETYRARLTLLHVSREAILKVVRDAGADLLVIGTHGRTGLAHLLLGSVAERLVRVADGRAYCFDKAGKVKMICRSDCCLYAPKLFVRASVCKCVALLR